MSSWTAWTAAFRLPCDIFAVECQKAIGDKLLNGARNRSMYKLRHPPVIDFFHIPKTAGTTVNEALIHYSSASKIRCFHTHYRRNGTAFNDLARFQQLPRKERNAFDMVIGHQDASIAPLIDRPVRYLFFGRDPIEAHLSLLQYNARRSASHIEFNTTWCPDVVYYPYALLLHLTGNFSRGKLSEASIAKWIELVRENVFFIGLQEQTVEAFCLLENTLAQLFPRRAHLQYPGKHNTNPASRSFRAYKELLSESCVVQMKTALLSEYVLHNISTYAFESQFHRFPKCRSVS